MDPFMNAITGSGGWKTPIYDPCPAVTCLKAYFLPCCSTMDHTAHTGHGNATLACLLKAFLPCIGCILCDIPNRESIRNASGIKGSIVDDIVCLFFCHCCTLMQMSRQAGLGPSNNEAPVQQAMKSLQGNVNQSTNDAKKIGS